MPLRYLPICALLAAIPLRAFAAGCDPQETSTRMRVLVDQVGYESGADKVALLAVPGGAAGERVTFDLRDDGSDATLWSGRSAAGQSVADWGADFYIPLDFSSFQRTGTFRLVAHAKGGDIVSGRFAVGRNVIEKSALSNIIYYFKGQRVSGQDDVADSHLPRVDGKPGSVDLHGGWYDATGDYGVHLSHQNPTNYFNPQQAPLVAWALLRAWVNLGARKDPDFSEFRKRLLDEGLYGADFLMRMKRPGQSFYESIDSPGPLKAAADRHIADPDWVTHVKTRPDESEWNVVRHETTDLTYQAGFRAGGGMAIAALALASTIGDGVDFTRRQYLAAAAEAYAYLAAHNAQLAFDHKANILDDYCQLLAAVELARATGTARWLDEAGRRARVLEDRLVVAPGLPAWWRADDGSRPFFHPSDAGLPVVALAAFAEIASGADRERALRAMRQAMEGELAVTGDVGNPFGYARQPVWTAAGGRRNTFFFPHDTEAAPWWQGENARLASLATAARMTQSSLSGDDGLGARLDRYALDQIHWILGRNPFDSAMLMGSGWNNKNYCFFASYRYFNAPGAILNGATSSVDSDNGIAFRDDDTPGGKDQTWRWTEQWLPHAAWFLLFVSLPHAR